MGSERAAKQPKDKAQRTTQPTTPQTDSPVSTNLTPENVLMLQRTAGNRAVQRLAAEGTIQRDDFRLGGSSSFHPHLLDEHLTLDPAIEAQIRAIQQLDTQLQPASLSTALGDLRLTGDLRSTPPPNLFPPNLGAGIGDRPRSPFDTPALTLPAPLVPAGEGPSEPRAADFGDLMRAVMRIPAVDGALTSLRTQAAERVRHDWESLSTGERALVITAGVVVGGGALAGVMTDEAARTTLLQQIEGRSIDVPGVPGFSFQFQLTGAEQNLQFSLDLARYIPALR